MTSIDSQFSSLNQFPQRFLVETFVISLTKSRMCCDSELFGSSSVKSTIVGYGEQRSSVRRVRPRFSSTRAPCRCTRSLNLHRCKPKCTICAVASSRRTRSRRIECSAPERGRLSNPGSYVAVATGSPPDGSPRGHLSQRVSSLDSC